MIDIDAKHKNIYDRLQDEESRELFMCRYKYWKTGDIAHLWDELHISVGYDEARSKMTGNTKQNIWDLLKNKAVGSKGVIVYGASRVGGHAISLLKDYQLEVLSVIDSAESKQGTGFANYQVEPPNKICEFCDCPVVVATWRATHQQELMTWCMRR